MDAVALLVAACALQAAGSVVQKQRVAARAPGVALAQVARGPGAFFGPLFRDPAWLLGGLVGFSGALVGLQVLSQMDLSVLKALGRMETLFAIGGGVWLLGERLRRVELAGVVALLAGASLLAPQAALQTGALASRTALLALAGGVVALALAAAAGRRGLGGRVPPELGLAGVAGCLLGLGDTLTKGATGLVQAAGGPDSFSVLAPASLVGLVRTPEFELALLAYVAGTVLVQAAFSVGRVSVVIPVLAIGSALLPIGFGLAVLHESPSAERLAGIALMLLGATLLGPGASRELAPARTPAPVPLGDASRRIGRASTPPRPPSA